MFDLFTPLQPSLRLFPVAALPKVTLTVIVTSENPVKHIFLFSVNISPANI